MQSASDNKEDTWPAAVKAAAPDLDDRTVRAIVLALRNKIQSAKATAEAAAEKAVQVRCADLLERKSALDLRERTFREAVEESRGMIAAVRGDAKVAWAEQWIGMLWQLVRLNALCAEQASRTTGVIVAAVVSGQQPLSTASTEDSLPEIPNEIVAAAARATGIAMPIARGRKPNLDRLGAVGR